MVCPQNAKKVAIGLLTFVMLTLGMLISTRVCAQVSGATMTGTVSDVSGAVITNAQLSIKNLGNGEVRTVITDASGLYAAPNLLPGKYEVTVTAPGFSTEVRSGLTLTVGAQQALNITMQVGQVSQKVEVTGEASAVQLANSTISGVVSQTAVVELPLNGRDWTALATLQPGVESIASIQQPVDSGFNRGERGFGVQMAVNGARPQQNSYRVDGINVNDMWNGGPGSVFGAALGVDAIQEFSVLTSNYSAEYGRTSGGVINAGTRSGTNQFHGDAYEFLRNSALDARNYFDPATIPEFRRNQFGGSAGGPIRKDRTFVFGDYEGLRQSLSLDELDSVPSQAARNGLLCSIPQPGVCSPQRVTGSPNPDPATGIDKAVLPYLSIWALPNAGLLGNGDTGFYRYVANQVTSENFVTARVDHRFSDKDSLFGSYQIDRATLTLPDALGSLLFGNTTRTQHFALEESHIFTPQLLNSFRVGFNRSFGTFNQGVKALIPAAGDPSLATIPGHDAPAIQVPGLTGFGGGLTSLTNGTIAVNAYQAYDDAFLTKGIHSLKLGFAFERDLQNDFQNLVDGGNFSFNTLGGFLTNHPIFFLGTIPGTLSTRNMAQNIFGGYVQDDVRLRPNLTVNFGLRYEMSTVPTEARGKLSALRTLTSPGPHIGNPLFSNPTLRNFEPRIGFAWDPFRNGKTSVRGGFGLFECPSPNL